jgi:hypothetical protein
MQLLIKILKRRFKVLQVRLVDLSKLVHPLFIEGSITFKEVQVSQKINHSIWKETNHKFWVPIKPIL